MNTDLLLASLSQLVVRLPILIAYGVGIILAIVWWKRHPQVSMLVVIALCVLALELVAGSVVSTVLPVKLHESGRTTAEIGAFFAAWGAGMSLITATCWGLIIAAVFSGRAPSTH